MLQLSTGSYRLVMPVVAGVGGVAKFALVYLSAANTVLTADAVAFATSKVRGVMMEAVTAGSRGRMQTGGIIRNSGWTLTVDKAVFLASGGGVTQDPTSIGVGGGLCYVGWAISPTELDLNVSAEVRKM